MKKLITLLMVCVLLAGCGGKKADNTTTNDGDFTASAESNIGGDVTVTITVKDGKISAASVDVSTQTVGYGADHQEDYVNMIVEANGAKLDNISGCTMTSMAIQEAYDAALTEAGLK